MAQKKLTPKQLAWIDEYLIDLNATQASIRAGYSKKTAKQQGAKNLSKAVLMDIVKERMAIRSEKTQTNAEWVLTTLRAAWEAKLSDIIVPKRMDEHGRVTGGEFKPVDEWPEIWQMMVSSFEVEELFDGFGADRELIGHTTKIRILQGKAQILKMLGDHVDVAAFAHNLKVSGKIELIDKVRLAQERQESMRNIRVTELVESEN